MNIYYEKYITFLKKHNIYNENIINHMNLYCTYFDYIDEEKRDFIGCFYTEDKYNRINKIHAFIPHIDSDITLLINLHEYIHLVILHDHLGKKYKRDHDEEILPMFYELLYYTENPTKELEIQIKNLNNEIKENSPLQYKIALEKRKEIFKYYKKNNPSFKQLQEKLKNLKEITKGGYQEK